MFSKQSKHKSMNKTFQVDTKQAMPTEHFNYFHDHTALYAIFFLLLSLLI